MGTQSTWGISGFILKGPFAVMSVENIEKFFGKIDADGDGKVTVTELTTLFDKWDKDGSGKLDKTEFSAGFTTDMGATDEQAAKCFAILDKDKDGEIEASEVKAFFTQMDADGSGDISKDEFVKFFASLLKQMKS